MWSFIFTMYIWVSILFVSVLKNQQDELCVRWWSGWEKCMQSRFSNEQGKKIEQSNEIYEVLGHL